MSSFNDQGFEKKLLALKDSQDSISTLSDWCLQNRQHHKKIVTSWLHVLKRVKVENRLTLFYLANDVIQYSKRKNYDFVESWGTALQKATTMVRDEKVIQRILRIFKIWGERNVYDDAFLSDLRGLLTAKKATPATPVEPKPTAVPTQPTPAAFEPPLLFLKINKCKELEDDTDLKLKIVNECKLKLNDLDAFRKALKDRRHADGVAGELDEAISQMEQYKKALEVEVLERKAVIELLQQAEKFYETERGEAKIVFNAYRNFGSRVKSQKRKLDELMPTLPSPLPSPDVNAPSPSPDSDIELPNDEDLSGIVECLEDLSDGVGDSENVESEVEEDDLMSLISYASSDDEPERVRYNWHHMVAGQRRRFLPIPLPVFSDSDLTDLEDIDENDEYNESYNPSVSQNIQRSQFSGIPIVKNAKLPKSVVEVPLDKSNFLIVSSERVKTFSNIVLEQSKVSIPGEVCVKNKSNSPNECERHNPEKNNAKSTKMNDVALHTTIHRGKLKCNDSVPDGTDIVVSSHVETTINQS